MQLFKYQRYEHHKIQKRKENDPSKITLKGFGRICCIKFSEKGSTFLSIPMSGPSNDAELKVDQSLSISL